MAVCLQYVTLFFFAYLRPEPTIITTQYASLACAGIEQHVTRSLFAWVMIFITVIDL
jgi:hypothetical protein